MNWQVLSLLTSTTFKTPEKPSFGQSYSSIVLFLLQIFIVPLSDLAAWHILPQREGLLPAQDCGAQQIHQDCSQRWGSPSWKNTKIQIHKNTPPWTTQKAKTTMILVSKTITICSFIAMQHWFKLRTPLPGRISYSQRLTITGRCAMDLRKFPLDTQVALLVTTRNQTIKI